MSADENLNTSQFKKVARRVMPYRVEMLADGPSVRKVNQDGQGMGPYFSYADSLRQFRKPKPYKSPGSSRMISGEGH